MCVPVCVCLYICINAWMHICAKLCRSNSNLRGCSSGVGCSIFEAESLTGLKITKHAHLALQQGVLGICLHPPPSFGMTSVYHYIHPCVFWRLILGPHVSQLSHLPSSSSISSILRVSHQGRDLAIAPSLYQLEKMWPLRGNKEVRFRYKKEEFRGWRQMNGKQ